jgi:hypothetical protein
MSNIRKVVISFEAVLVTDCLQYFQGAETELYDEIMNYLNDKSMQYALIDKAKLTIEDKGEVCL